MFMPIIITNHFSAPDTSIVHNVLVHYLFWQRLLVWTTRCLLWYNIWYNIWYNAQQSLIKSEKIVSNIVDTTRAFENKSEKLDSLIPVIWILCHLVSSRFSRHIFLRKRSNSLHFVSLQFTSLQFVSVRIIRSSFTSRNDFNNYYKKLTKIIHVILYQMSIICPHY